jgi:peptidoglycan/LPS O-acetylase OafA/YrhL
MSALNSFDVVRLFAALLVVYGHAYPLTGAASPHFAGNSVQAIGVKIFFVISGYLILGSWQRDPSAWRFFLRRALRILPGLIVVVLICALILGSLLTSLPGTEYFQNGRSWTYLTNIMMRPQYDLPGVFMANVYPNAVNGSLWSLPAEVAMYVIGPLACVLGAVCLRTPRRGAVLATSVLLALSIWLLRVSSPATTPVVYGSSLLSFLDVAPYFMVGGLYSLYKAERFFNPVVAAALWILLSVVSLPGLISELTLYLVLPYVVLTLGTQTTWLGSRLHKFGDISYGVYLYGFPLQQCVALLVPFSRDSAWLNATFTLVPLLIAATLSWRYVERPFMQYKPSTRRLPPRVIATPSNT